MCANWLCAKQCTCAVQVNCIFTLRDSCCAAHAVHEWTLPSTAFVGLWDSLIYDTDVKVCLRFSTVMPSNQIKLPVIRFAVSGRPCMQVLHCMHLTMQHSCAPASKSDLHCRHACFGMRPRR